MAKNSDQQVFSKLHSGITTCIGLWCGHKRFFSPDKTKYRYCKNCAAKRDQEVKNLPGIKVCTKTEY